MQGLILDAAVTSNQGLIRGDDGARYTFGPGGWRDASVKAEAGMRVEFSPQGAAAVDVLVIQAAPPPAPAPPAPAPPVSPVYPQPAPPQMRQASYPPPASQPPPQRRPFTVPATPVPRTPQPGQPQGYQPPQQQPAYTAPATPAPSRPPSAFVPRYPKAEQDKVTMALLMILLGPLGWCIVAFMLKAYPGQVIGMVVLIALVEGQD